MNDIKLRDNETSPLLTLTGIFCYSVFLVGIGLFVGAVCVGIGWSVAMAIVKAWGM